MTQRTIRLRVISLFVATVIATVTYPAGAQMLEEIIVTAQKREQNVQDVGIAITAFSGTQLKELRMTESTDVAYMSAGVFVSGSSAGQTREFTIRGVTQNDFADLPRTRMLPTSMKAISAFARVMCSRLSTSNASRS